VFKRGLVACSCNYQFFSFIFCEQHQNKFFHKFVLRGKLSLIIHHEEHIKYANKFNHVMIKLINIRIGEE